MSGTSDPLLELVDKSHLVVPLLFFALVGVLHAVGWLVDALAELACSVMRSLARVRTEYRSLVRQELDRQR